jgi:hypothetical protein
MAVDIKKDLASMTFDGPLQSSGQSIHLACYEA